MMLSLVAACFSAEHSVGLTIGALASRAFLGFSVEHSFGLPRQGPWILALHDAISFAVFLSSFFGTSVAWRGYSYRILRDGTLEKEN